MVIISLTWFEEHVKQSFYSFPLFTAYAVISCVWKSDSVCILVEWGKEKKTDS